MTSKVAVISWLESNARHVEELDGGRYQLEMLLESDRSQLSWLEVRIDAIVMNSPFGGDTQAKADLSPKIASKDAKLGMIKIGHPIAVDTLHRLQT